jgi:hypothetical protein
MITLSYPKTGSPTYQVELRNPSFQDEIETALGTVNTNNRNGQPLSVRPTSWLTINTLRFSFTPVTQAKIAELKTFLANTAALELEMVDHLGRTWHGFITSGQNDIINIQEPCTREVNFVFEGDIQ